MAYSDDISTAPEITVDGTDGDWDNLTATDNPGEPVIFIGSSNNCVWQKVFLASPGLYRFGHDTSVPGDTVMVIWSGPPGAAYVDLFDVGADDDGGGNSKPLIDYTSAGGEWIYVESSAYGGDRISGQRTFITAVVPHDGDGWQDNLNGSWSALMGDYVGHWPMQPPPRLDTDDANVGFLVGAPAPIDDRAVDEFYGAPGESLWQTVLFASSPDSWSLGGSNYGDPKPPVAVLVITVNTFSGDRPANPPGWYVPAGYTETGAAPQERSEGHWSAWLAGLDERQQSSMPIIGGRPDIQCMISGGATDSHDDFRDLVPVEQAALDAAVAALAFFASSDNLVFVSAWDKASRFGEPDLTEASVTVNQSFRQFQASPFDPVPPLGTEWIDYSPDPTSGDSYEYEAPGTFPDFAWEPANWIDRTDFFAGATGLSTDLHVLQHDAFPTALVPTPVSGTEIGSDTNIGGADRPFAVTPIGSDHTIYTSFYADPLGGSRGTSFVADGSPPMSGAYEIEILPIQFYYHWTTSRWRYWIPGALVPSIGGDFSVLRLNQRNDQLGISQHPRLFGATGMPNLPMSVQQPSAPRLPQNPNTYQ